MIDGTVQAEVAVDRVVGERLLRGAGSSTWQELEVELVDGDQDFLDRIDLEAAGLELSPALYQGRACARRPVAVDDAARA